MGALSPLTSRAWDRGAGLLKSHLAALLTLEPTRTQRLPNAGTSGSLHSLSARLEVFVLLKEGRVVKDELRRDDAEADDHLVRFARLLKG